MYIKLYNNIPPSDENIKKGIPLNIPAIVSFEIPEDIENWQEMNNSEYLLYLESIKEDLDRWTIIQASLVEEVDDVII